MTSNNAEHFGYWNDPAVAADLRAASPGVTEFARKLEATLPPNASVVELGCGPGDDAAFLAEHGHLVIGLDISEPLVEMAEQRFADRDGLEFRRADISKPLHVGSESCDAVIARLSLHYFDDETTARIFGEVHWILRSGGTFTFVCRSTDDPMYGKGIHLARHMYEFEGSVRHFFTKEYAHDLMEDTGFIDIETSTGTDRFYGQPSAYVLCSGRKI